MSRDFMSDTGLDEKKPELNSEALFKTAMPEALPTSGPFRPGVRVKHRNTGQTGRIKFVGKNGGRSIGCEWDGDHSVGMFTGEELTPEP